MGIHVSLSSQKHNGQSDQKRNGELIKKKETRDRDEVYRDLMSEDS